MIYVVSKLSEKIYQNVSKPLIFKFISPDTTHETMLRIALIVQKIGLLRWLINKSWSYQNEKVLSQGLHGIHFKNPVGLSAGLDKNFVMPRMVSTIGFGLMEGGSITYKPTLGNEKPWFYRLPKSKSLVVNVGLANEGVQVISERIKNQRKFVPDMPLNISVAKTNDASTATDEYGIKDYVSCLKVLKRKNIGDLITINISCPNTFGGEPFTTPKRLKQLLDEVDKLKLHQPVFVKMPCDKTNDEFIKLLDVVAKHNIKGVTISNLYKDRKTAKLNDDLPDSVVGNLSGLPVQQCSNELIALAYKKYGKKLTIIGVGGIFNASDAYKKIRLGASLVEMITGLIFEGPQVVGQINRELAQLLKKDGFKNISEAIGVDSKARLS